MASNKPHMNLVIIGHVDHGKSTLTGRILLETGAIDPHIIEKYKKEAEEKGKGSFYFAWVMDGLKEERERGVTIDVAHKKFEGLDILSLLKEHHVVFDVKCTLDRKMVDGRL